MTRFAVLTLLCSWSCVALTLQVQGNPIRKVVTLLQDMQKEIQAEGEKEKDLFEKFMCYCNGNTDGMSKSSEDAAQAIVELQSKLEAEKAEKSQLDQELIKHKQDREAAKNDLATANSIREKEHADYEASVGDQKSNLDALNGAVAALEKGMGAKAFLQASTQRLVRLRKIATVATLDDYDRSSLTSFLSGTQNPFGDYSAQSGEIVGILKAMRDEMDKDLNGAIGDESAAQKSFEDTSAAKKAEIKAASTAVESKTERTGALAVSIVTTQNDIEDTTAEMKDTQAFLANLKAQCETKKKEWAERSQLRAEEVKAISEVIAILNDDDALDIFKKTLSLAQQTSSMAFLQRRSGSSATRRARDILAAHKGPHGVQFALIEQGLKAKAVDFSKVLKMIADMQSILDSEQKDDDSQMSFCEKDLDRTANEKADTESAIEVSAALIEETESASATLADEVAQLQKDVKALDAAVGDATEQRKNEHGEYVQFQTENNAALQLIEKAKNRLFKLYRPNLYKEAPKQELTDEEKILASSGRSDLIATTAEPGFIAGTTQRQMAFVQIATNAAPPPPPETWGAYKKKDGKSNGVIQLIENLMKELQDGITESKHDEETAQKDYERLMSESQATRAENVKGITSKEAAKADLDVKAEEAKEQKASQETSLADLNGYIAQLHAQCDFLVQNYDARKAARANEVESLKNAKAVLSGADFS